MTYGHSPHKMEPQQASKTLFSAPNSDMANHRRTLTQNFNTANHEKTFTQISDTGDPSPQRNVIQNVDMADQEHFN